MPRKEPGFAERLQTAANAKKAQLERIRATTLANAVQSAERQAARVDTAAAPEIRTADRKQSNRVAGEQRDTQRAAAKTGQAQAVTEQTARKNVGRVAQAEDDAALGKDQKLARKAQQKRG